MAQNKPESAKNQENDEEETKYRKKTLSTAQETIIIADEMVNGIKTEKDPIKELYDRSANLLKALNNNKNFSLTTFKAHFNSFIENGEVPEDNEILEQSLTNMFVLLKDNMDKDRLLAMNTRTSANSIIESLILEIKSKKDNIPIMDIVKEFHEKAISQSNMTKILEFAVKWGDLLASIYK